MRNSWIKSRIGRKNNTQMNFARNGEITEEMNFVAKREKQIFIIKKTKNTKFSCSCCFFFKAGGR